MTQGKIIQVIGPVLDVAFPDGRLPNIQEALLIRRSVADPSGRGAQGAATAEPATEAVLTLEVAQHIGDGAVRAIALGSTEGLSRGMAVEATGAPITVPVGPACLGRLMNVVGEPMDFRGEIKADTRLPIHRAPPSFTDQKTTPEVF